MMQKPRLPNQYEINELQSLLLSNLHSQMVDIENTEFENILRLIDSASIAVFDNYVTDTPPEPPIYAGKLMSVVWSLSPTHHEIYVWKDRQLQLIQSPTCGE